MVFEEFSNREGDIVTGVIQRLEPKHAVVDLGKTEAILPAPEQVRSEHLRGGQRMKFYLLEVHRSIKGPQLILSRTHKNLLKRLFELEVPEIHRGTVEIKSIAREAGYRSKVAVSARQEGVDPVGSCVGLRGIRIQNIVNELNGERIDVIQWDPEASKFVANALSPAQVLTVRISEDDNTASVIVPDRQLSLAIGKEGQNARLAAKLTGWRIDIKPESAMQEALAGAPAPAAAATTTAAPARPRRPADAGDGARRAETAEPWKEVVESDGEAPAAETPEAEPAPAEIAATATVEAPVAGGPRIRFAEDIGGGRVASEPKKKKSKKDERGETEGKAAKKPSKKARPVVEDEDEDLEIDFGFGKDEEDAEE
jgi:N utilization substance protein A